jgi:hypothetical protein
MAAAFIGIIIGALVGVGTLALPTVRLLHAADSAAATLYSLAESQLSKIEFLQQNATYKTALLGCIAVIAPGVVAALVAAAARSLGALRSVIAAGLALLSLWALISLPLQQSMPLVLIAGLVFVSAVFPAILALRVVLWAIVGYLGTDHALAVWARTDETVNATIVSFTAITRIDSPELWRILLSVLALVPFYGAISSATRSKG